MTKLIPDYKAVTCGVCGFGHNSWFDQYDTRCATCKRENRLVPCPLCGDPRARIDFEIPQSPGLMGCRSCVKYRIKNPLTEVQLAIRSDRLDPHDQRDQILAIFEAGRQKFWNNSNATIRPSRYGRLEQLSKEIWNIEYFDPLEYDDLDTSEIHLLRFWATKLHLVLDQQQGRAVY